MATIRPDDLEGLREHVAAALARVQAKPVGEWRISDEDHRLMVTLADLEGVPLPTDAFGTSEGAIAFLRAARLALGEPVSPTQSAGTA